MRASLYACKVLCVRWGRKPRSSNPHRNVTARLPQNAPGQAQPARAVSQEPSEPRNGGRSLRRRSGSQATCCDLRSAHASFSERFCKCLAAAPRRLQGRVGRRSTK
eukprot:9777446-Karenia_brevis.AAC.1